METVFGKGLSALVLDDEPSVLMLLREILTSNGFTVVVASTVQDALAAWLEAECEFDVLLVDKNLPDGSGLDFIERIKGDNEDTAVILMTAYANLQSAIEAMRLSTADYLLKPFGHPHELSARLERVVDRLLLKRHNTQLIDQLRTQNQQLEQLVVRDGLTGLYNHAFLQEQIASEINRSYRTGDHFGLIFIDVDHFKEINDNLGHQTGDEMLKRIATSLRGILRVNDLLARYGGDEFVALLPSTDKTGTAIMAERLRERIETIEFETEIPGATLSVGVSSFPEDGATREELVRAADSALYASKSLGRNQVVSYTAELTDSDSITTKRFGALKRTLLGRLLRFEYRSIVEPETSRTIAYESICRPLEANFSDWDDLFTSARRAGKIRELGRLAREIAIEPLGELPPQSLLFIGLHPVELNDPMLTSSSHLLPLADKIVLEIKHTNQPGDTQKLHSRLAHLKKHGFRVSLDEVAVSYMGLHAIAEVAPDFAKLDCSTLRNFSEHSGVYKMARHFVEYAKEEHIQVIAAGIESDSDHQLAVDLGCPLVATSSGASLEIRR